jgi:diguanylate cyclase (GGDEF)-like protein
MSTCLFLSSRLLYSSYCRDLASNLALISANEQLETKSGQIQQINDKLIHANFQLRQLSLVDDLTGIANRRGLRNFISQVFEQSDFEIDKLAVIILDIDNFKLYNDNYGHLAGDQVLSAIAGVLEGLIRPPLEIAARWGGEEFIFLSFNISADSLADLAEKIRRQTESLGIPHTFSPTTPVITISVGTCLKPISSASEVAPIIEAADNALYIAKRKGRNQVSDGQSGPGEPDTSQSCQPARIYPVITPQQASVAAELAGRIWREHYTAIIGARQVEYMLNQFQTPERIWQDISQNDYRYDLVETAGQLAGYMAVKPDAQENELFLSKLYIDRKFRKQGLARQMVDTLIRRCRETGWQSIWLTVNKNNHASIAVYEKMGFIRTSSVVNEIGEGYVMDDYVMRLSLS